LLSEYHVGSKHENNDRGKEVFRIHFLRIKVI
jgi:hypothetical protein